MYKGQNDIFNQTGKHPNALILLFLVVLPFVLYWPSFSYDFIATLDDDWLILKNPDLQDFSLKGILHIISSGGIEMNYHPLTYISLAFDHHLFGFDPRAMKMHNVLLHCITSILCYIFLFKLGFKKWIALMTATIYALHPLQMESVIWVIGRRNVLFMSLTMASLILYLQSNKVKSKEWFYYSVAIAFWMLAMMAKASAIVIPALFVLITWYQGISIKSRKSMMKVMATIPVVILFFYLNWVAEESNELVRQFNYAWWEHIFFVGYTFTWYWIKAIFPYPLSIFYPAVSEHNNLPLHYILYSFFSLGMIVAAFFAWKKERKEWILIIGFYLITIGLKLNKILLPGDIPILVGDRYFYMSGLAICLGFVLVAWLLVRNKRILSIAFIGYIVFLFLFVRNQMPNWNNDQSLVSHTLKHYPNEEMYHRLAIIYRHQNKFKVAYDQLLLAEQLEGDIWINNNWYEEFEKGEICLTNNDFELGKYFFENSMLKEGKEFALAVFYLGICNLALGDQSWKALIDQSYSLTNQEHHHVIDKLLEDFLINKQGADAILNPQ